MLDVGRDLNDMRPILSGQDTKLSGACQVNVRWRNQVSALLSITLKVFVSDYTTEGTPGQQTFFANLTASAVS